MKVMTTHNTQIVVVKMKVVPNEAIIHTPQLERETVQWIGIKRQQDILLDKGMISGKRWKSYQHILH